MARIIHAKRPGHQSRSPRPKTLARRRWGDGLGRVVARRAVEGPFAKGVSADGAMLRFRASPQRRPESDRGSHLPRSGRVFALSSCLVGRESPRLVDRIGWNRRTVTRWLPVGVDRYSRDSGRSPSFSIGWRACPVESVSRGASGAKEGSREPRMENGGERRRGAASLRRSEHTAPFELRGVPPVGEVAV